MSDNADTENIINHKRYPAQQLTDSEGDLVTRVRFELNRDGASLVPDFVGSNVLQRMVQQAEGLAHLAYPGPNEATPYFFDYDLAAKETVSDKHPLRRTTRRNLAQIAADLIPSEHLLSKLYHSPLMLTFLSKVLGRPVFRNADPYQCLNISVMHAGGCQQWHFDAGNMVTTLLLQEPEGGGIFEYVPNVRSKQDENYDQVQRILDGERDSIRELRLRAGTLTLFRGHYSLHRVTDVTGVRKRLQAILGYTTEAGMVGSANSSVLHYGRRVLASYS